MKKKLLVFFVLLYISNFGKSQELITDRHFQWGFFVVSPNANIVQGNIQFNTSIAPYWRVCQWNSQTSLINLSPVVLPSGFHQWADNNKDFRFGPQGAENYDLYFAANSENEYNGIYRQQGEPWPHLLVEQSFQNCPTLAQMSSLNFSADVQLLYSNIIVQPGYDPGLHAAQFLCYFTVQNLNPSNPGYGKFIWLGVPMYDDRNATPDEVLSWDIGTQSLIYGIDYNNCAAQSVQSGNLVHFGLDILPYAMFALDTAWSVGILTESTNYNDYRIGGMNIGWELPGREIVTMVIKDLSLIANLTTSIPSETENVCFSISPNPCKNFLTIEFPSGEFIGSAVMEIFSTEGKLMVEKNISPGQLAENTFFIVVCDLKKGIYFLKIRNGSLSHTKKIVIM